MSKGLPCWQREESDIRIGPSLLALAYKVFEPRRNSAHQLPKKQEENHVHFAYIVRLKFYRNAVDFQQKY